MRKTTEYAAVFTVGAVVYALIELLWRGRTHWTMMITGGACLVFIYFVEKRYETVPRWKRCFTDTVMISLSELTVGFFVNMLLDWHVWDYSKLPLNLFGQICPLYAALWFLLCIPATYACTAVHRCTAHRRVRDTKALS